MERFEAHATSPAPREAVWALLATTSSWPAWADFDEAELERPGDPDPEGVGAVRRFRRGRRETRERVVAFEPPSHFAYELVSGIPIRDYRAEVTLSETDGGGTRIEWRSRFRGRFPVPARLARPRLQAFVQDTAERLAEAAERGYA